MSSDPKFRALLVGIAAYPVRPLRGGVNDIDAEQQPGTAHEPAMPEQPATRENLRAARAGLGSDAVGPADRVFDYTSGEVLLGDGIPGDV